MYYIYHIPGIKVGCTDNLQRRTSVNKRKYGKDVEIIVLKIETKVTKADMWEAYYHSKLGYGIIPIHERYLSRVRISKQKIGSKLSPETKAKVKESSKGKHLGSLNSRYGKGLVYKELTTGITGFNSEILSKFEMKYLQYIHNSIRTGKPISRGKFKGLHFVVLNK